MLPVKQMRIQGLGQTIPANCCTKRIKTFLNDFFWGNHHTFTECIFQSTWITPGIRISSINIKYPNKESNHMLIVRKIHPHLRSSAVIWRWKLDASSAKTDESDSSDFVNLMFPRCRIAATILKIASGEEEGWIFITSYYSKYWKQMQPDI